jgi:hypothetical protein
MLCKMGWWFRWPRCLKRGTAAVLLLGLRVRILPLSWTSISCDCCVLSGTDLCVGLITRPEESYRLWCVWVWSLKLINEAAKDRQTQVLIERWLCPNSLFKCRCDCQTDNHEYSSPCSWENFYEPWTFNDEGHAFFSKRPETLSNADSYTGKWE